ncbi:MAG: zf-HC2 domain-containing protein [Pirellulales bacterium]|nr:zf-HC2 domain-containing protein [Pirellulales bacterium]
MNDPTQNELLGAYLDGELTADEQAEVERLLAADPAARQLLDDLRALSVALQALPQEKVGEDLSEAVLRAAARRVLLDGPPGEQAGSTPVAPLGRSFFRRLFNVRGLAYAGLAAAFALMIVFLEWNQLDPAARNEGKQTARAVRKPERSREERDGLPPSIQSARDSVVAPAAAPPPLGSLAMKSAKSRDLAPRDESSIPDRSELLVIHCDVTSDALAEKAFEKLLAANGIVRGRRLGLSELESEGKGFARSPGQVKKDADEPSSDAAGAPPPLEADEVSLIYVEATPAQIEAALAALAAEPRAFANISANPPQGIASAALFFGRPMRAGREVGGGEGRREKSAAPAPSGRGGRGAFDAAKLEESGNGERGPVDKKHKTDEAPQEAEQARPEKAARQAAPPTRPAARRRVLFVLRNVAVVHSPAAEAAKEKPQ